jgi:hypothetical protein
LDARLLAAGDILIGDSVTELHHVAVCIGAAPDVLRGG